MVAACRLFPFRTQCWINRMTAVGTFVSFHQVHSEYLRGRFGAESCRRARFERLALNDAQRSLAQWPVRPRFRQWIPPPSPQGGRRKSTQRRVSQARICQNQPFLECELVKVSIYLSIYWRGTQTRSATSTGAIMQINA